MNKLPKCEKCRDSINYPCPEHGAALSHTAQEGEG